VLLIIRARARCKQWSAAQLRDGASRVARDVRQVRARREFSGYSSGHATGGATGGVVSATGGRATAVGIQERTICYVAHPMAKRFTKKRKNVSSGTDTATSAQDKVYARLRARAERALRKRRREKSHQ
jgi:hypothetical protein